MQIVTDLKKPRKGVEDSYGIGVGTVEGAAERQAMVEFGVAKQSNRWYRIGCIFGGIADVEAAEDTLKRVVETMSRQL